MFFIATFTSVRKYVLWLKFHLTFGMMFYFLTKENHRISFVYLLLAFENRKKYDIIKMVLFFVIQTKHFLMQSNHPCW